MMMGDMAQGEEATAAHETTEEMFLSLNGFDEIAIAKAFGQDISAWIDDEAPERQRPFTFVRALIFVHIRRTSDPRVKDADAYRAAMSLSQEQLQAYFADDPGELDPDDPDTDQGKGDRPSD
ncbi:MAG: hypothetical protein ACRDQA_03490 [Nocardioidaceae bacterium]